MTFPLIRLCCGKRHGGVVCPDGLVMCCICFERKKPDQLNVNSDGQIEDVCKECEAIDRKIIESLVT